MGFGASTTVGNVAVDLVQADVDGIIAGIANGKTLADLYPTLYSSTAGKGAADLLYSTNSAKSVADSLYASSIGETVAQLLSDGSYSACDYLYNIDQDLDYLYSSGSGYGVADELYYAMYDSSNYRWLIDYYNTSNGYEPLFYSGYSLAYMIYQLYSCISGGRLLVTDQH